MPATKPRKSKPAKDRFDVYQAVTDIIIEALEKGTVPWRKPWRSTAGQGIHRNFTSKRPYRGVNQFLLELVASAQGYTQPHWLTFKQMQEKGGSLVKVNGEDEPGTGQRASLVVFWKMIRVADTNPDGSDKRDKQGRKVMKQIPVLKYFKVFNIEQTDLPLPELEPVEEFKPLERAEEILKGYFNTERGPKLKRPGGDRAYYNPALDFVQTPKPIDFTSPEDYYATAFHEGVHATGHEKRLNREEIVKGGINFGDEDYSREELVAEMGASMLCAYSEIKAPALDDLANSSAYIASWLGKLKGDKKFVVSAASRAHRAADYVLNIEPVQYEANGNGEAH